MLDQKIIDVLNHRISREEFSSCMEILEETLKHELQITRECEKLHDLGVQLKKPSLQELALRFCKEQDEEISKALDLLDHAKLTDDMLVFDHYVEKYL
jgi:ferritin